MAGARMDSVTRHPIFGIPRVTGLALDEGASYTIQLVDVGPEASGWSQGEPQAWPRDHQAQLQDTGSRGASYGLRAFPGQPSPRPLYLEEEEEEEELRAYYLEARGARPRQLRDLEQERWAVVQDQAVRRSGTVATLQGTPDHGDPRPPGRPPTAQQEDSSVDREQIDFLAAREQFLSLEQANAGVPRTPLPRVSTAPKALNGPLLANGYVPGQPLAKEVVREDQSIRGLSSGPRAQGTAGAGPGSLAESSEPPKETPIEREIRLAQEREAALRAQRGLQPAGGPQELVQVPSRPLLTSVSLSEAPRRDRRRPSLYVQRDLVQETQREEDHRRQGRQAGRAATPDERGADHRAGLRRVLSSDAILSPTPDARAADPPPEVRRVNRIPPDAYQPYLNSGGPPLEFSAFGVPRKPAGRSSQETKVVAPTMTPPGPGAQRTEPPGQPGPAVRSEYFLLRPLRFRAPEEPLAWGREAETPPAWRLQRSQSSELLEREVERVLRREREVEQERDRARAAAGRSPPADERRGPGSRSSSWASGITGSYSVSESPTVSPVHLHSDLVWTAEAPGDQAPRQRRKEWYAGINPSDGINSEVLGATRVTRHKNALAERWEAGIYASGDED
ncbi:mitotic interactor and substrate of PLK1 [Oryctolagus cuniculus]|uniref:mitotic interactor and substrate of PLK1 n=1 Tax=Oryctolagus cuniculus TaxID=9986 RepID=UPI00223284A6|nr:mitotic interactor and substrate of PLK1 [Oryctolagus cuniculus]XP_051698267.1 mitotic interactor and substrate of PLK1 [Oryctolagus cuniculus]